jgi:oligoendopeptidase F
MPVAEPFASAAALDTYRGRADRFEAEMMEEYYLHFAGRKDELEIEPIYERYQDLTTLEAAAGLGAGVDGDRGIRELWQFACSGYLGNLTKSQEARASELEATLTASVDGQTIPYRMLRPAIANEPDRAKRQALEQARCRLCEEHLNPVHLEASAILRAALPGLGSPDYVDLHRRFGLRLDELADQCRRLLDDTERLYEENLDRLFRTRVGIPLSEAERWDTPRLVRGVEWDPVFPSARMVPALEGTLAGLGVDFRDQTNVELDVEQREKKSPRAFCAPIEVPSRVVLVMKPIGGPDDWRALFHEAGHTEHFANTAADLPVESRRMGDYAVTEGWAFLFEHLVDDPAWLTRRLDFPRPREFAAEGAGIFVFFVRRYCAKLLYELELFAADDPLTMKTRYVELLGDALKISPSATDWLADVDSGFYVTRYLRAWAFEAQLSFHLRERFGGEWFATRDAGSLLRELWSLGQSLSADELLEEVTGAEIDMGAVTERVRERLR